MCRQHKHSVKGCVNHLGTRTASFRSLTATKKLRLSLLLVGPLFLCSLLWAQTESFKIVVHASNPVASMTKQQVSRLFLKKDDRWENGFRVTPADQALDGPTGEAFCTAVHEKEAKEIKGHWIKVVFSGLGTPPMELNSDQEVLDFVKHNVGAIGYVSAGAPIGDGVKVLSLSD